MYVLLFILFIVVFFYSPFLIYKKGFSLTNVSIWLASIYFLLRTSKFLQTGFNIITITNSTIEIKRPLLFFNYSIPKESTTHVKDIKQIQSEAIPALMQTCYNLENKDGEIIDHFFRKKSKKQLAKIKSILPQLF